MSRRFASVHLAAKYLRLIAEALEPIGLQPTSLFPDSRHSPFKEMLQCVQNGESWQDAMDSNTEEVGRAG